MSHKSARIEDRLRSLTGQRLDARYLGFFECFNRRLFFEAHEVLEDLWLQDRNGPDGDFHKGLIQLAGAFVHIQKQRPAPAIALLDLARRNLEKYPTRHWELDLAGLVQVIARWRGEAEARQNRPSELAGLEPPVVALSTPLFSGGTNEAT